MSPGARVAVILVNHNEYAHQYLKACWDSFSRQTYSSNRTQLFIVTNGSSEKTIAYMRRVCPPARIIETPGNWGWAKSNNVAIKVALEEGFDYLVMLNMDTELEPDWLRALVRAADQRTETHILQSKLLLGDTQKINSLGNRTHFLGYGYCNAFGEEESQVSQRMVVDYASGAAMLVKRKVFETVGLFREEYFLYYDDMEFCWRARLAGFNIGLVKESVCRHKYEFTKRLTYRFYYQRNRLLTLLTLERIGTLILIAPCLIISEVVVMVYFLIRGWWKTVWQLLVYFLRPATWRWILARRREIRDIRVRKDAEIVQQFAATIIFMEFNGRTMRYLINPLLWVYWTLVRRLIIW